MSRNVTDAHDSRNLVRRISRDSVIFKIIFALRFMEMSARILNDTIKAVF